MAVDCIGLRGIQFMDHDSVPSPDGSPWYEILEAGRSCLEANVEFNVWLPWVSSYSVTNMARVSS